MPKSETSGLIRTEQLLAGDVLLYHGTAWISKMIRLFDGGDYSHASIYTGQSVAEAVGEGIISDPVEKSVAGAEYVDVYRFTTSDGKRLRDPGFPDVPVRQRIDFYFAKRERYAFEQILLLAALASTRRLPVVGWIPGLSLILRTILDSAGELVTKLIALGREPMICSEFVYRCYDEAEGTKYQIKIVGADILRAQSAQAFAAAALQAQPTPEQRDL